MSNIESPGQMENHFLHLTHWPYKNKFLAILMSNIESSGQMENYFLHLTQWPFKILKTQIQINRQWEMRLHGNHHE